MSNNKQSMKLYTEEQVKHMLIGLIGATRTVDDFLHRHYTPIELPSDEIELPSDEEIHKQAINYTGFDNEFKAGAKWMRDKIWRKQ